MHLASEIKNMKKATEEMQMSLNEKDAEIIKLNMHLGDERKKNSHLQRVASSSRVSQ